MYMYITYIHVYMYLHASGNRSGAPAQGGKTGNQK